MSFPTYPAYKDSGVEWLGEMPEHWVLKRFKQIFIERSERSADGSEELMSVSAYYGVKPRLETLGEGDHLTRAESLEGYKICRKNDLVMNIMLAWNRGLGFAWSDGMVSPAYSVFSVADGSWPAYLDYLVRSDEMIRYYKSFSAGVIDSRLRLYPESFGRLYAAVPPSKEQVQIARFLDHETARIDALIAEQQRLIELLKEKRQAVISHAVTKGLNPDVPMKDSGVEWLGQVPAHWEVKRLKHLCEDIKAGPFGSALTKDMYVASGYKIYGQEQVIPGDFSIGDYYIDSGCFESLAQYQVLPGDVLISCVGTFGKIAIVPDAVEPGIINPRLIRIRSNHHVVPRYLVDVLRSDVVFEQFSVLSRGGTMDVINIGTLSGIVLAIPPLVEQIAILSFVEEQARRLNGLMLEASKGVALLQERRSALISAAVTGKIDVRRWQPPADAAIAPVP